MTIPSWARVGAKVVCVDAAHGYVTGLPVPFTKGALLTISAVIDASETRNGLPGIQFDGIDSAGRAFRIARFRPLVDENIEATLFRSKGLHNRSPRKAGVDA